MAKLVPEIGLKKFRESNGRTWRVHTNRMFITEMAKLNIVVHRLTADDLNNHEKD